MTADGALTYESLAAVLDREGIIGERYVIGRNRKLQDQVVVGDGKTQPRSVGYLQRHWPAPPRLF